MLFAGQHERKIALFHRELFSGFHDYNPFTFDDIVQVLEGMCMIVKTRKEKTGEPSDLEMGICFQTSFAPSIIIFALSTLSKLEIFIKHLRVDKYTITVNKSIRFDGSNKPGTYPGLA
jgi:hypothetical protein